MSEVENNRDFICWLAPDLSIKILAHLNSPYDLASVSAVSSTWHRFVVENGFSKQFCLKRFPELSFVTHFLEADNIIEPIRYVPGNSMNWECLKRIHRVYAFLACGLTLNRKSDCISEAIIASSTDNYPREEIRNTMDRGVSYWSSKGESDPSVPETLVYKLISKICVVTEIHLRPFEAYFQQGNPIYSPKFVRFRMGYRRHQKKLESPAAGSWNAQQTVQNEDLVWTYTSPEFPMAQKNRTQKFKLPEPVLCIGGILQVELLGRVQKQQTDELYYICISCVGVVGRPLSQGFNITVHYSGKCTLKYYFGNRTLKYRR